MTVLSGMGEICKYVNRSESTALKWIRENDFPAKKFGGIWESDSRLIDEWRRDQIQNAEPEKPSRKNPGMKSRKKSK